MGARASVLALTPCDITCGCLLLTTRPCLILSLPPRLKARGGYRRRARAGQPQSFASPEAPEDDDLAYVWHELEAHHTLAGIALQYRVTIEQLKSANQLNNEAELVTRARLMIPTHKFGSLFANPEEHRSADAGSKTHTTANPK
jgi:hypothetical protein